MSLDEKRTGNGVASVIAVLYIKQFIKELKEEINDHQFHMIIDALAGKGLI